MEIWSPFRKINDNQKYRKGSTYFVISTRYTVQAETKKSGFNGRKCVGFCELLTNHEKRFWGKW